MGNTDILSIGLGVISVILAIYSVWQSWRYKNLGNKLEENTRQIIKVIHENSVYSALVIRHIDEKLFSKPNTANLHKDELYIYKNCKYKPSNVVKVVDKLKRELPGILKQTYIDSIVAALNIDDGSSDEIRIVTLRRQYDENDLDKIRKLNEVFFEDGISFEIKIS